MKEIKFLSFLDRFKSFYEKIGVDYQKMRLILQLKLTLDRRRQATAINGKVVKDEEEKNNFKYALMMYAFMGGFMGIFSFLPFNAMYKYTIILSIFMFFILTIFISDFSSVLLDVRDKNLIGIRGVEARTINAAKITHMAYYIFLTSMALEWLSIIGMFKDGLFIGLLFLLELIVIDMFMIVITALLYLVILRIFNGEKVKDIINYIQIILTIVMAVGYQLIARMFNFADMKIIYKEKVWNMIFPPMWFSAPLYMLKEGKCQWILMALMIMAVLVPLIAVLLYIKNTDKFEAYLYKLNLSNEKEKGNSSIFYKVGKVFCKGKEEKAAYGFITSLIHREREFKLRVYPNVGMTLIFPLLFILIMQEGVKSLTAYRSGGLTIALNIYWMVLIIPSTLIMLQFSKSYKGHWVFETTGIRDKSILYKAAYKSVAVNMILPVFIFESIIFIFLFGARVIPTLIICILSLYLLLPFIHSINKFKYPFSEEFSPVNQNQAQSIVSFFSTFLLVALLVGINFFLMGKIYGEIIYILLLILINYFAWHNGIKVKVL